MTNTQSDSPQSTDINVKEDEKQTGSLRSLISLITLIHKNEVIA